MGKIDCFQTEFVFLRKSYSAVRYTRQRKGKINLEIYISRMQLCRYSLFTSEQFACEVKYYYILQSLFIAQHRKFHNILHSRNHKQFQKIVLTNSVQVYFSKFDCNIHFNGKTNSIIAAKLIICIVYIRATHTPYSKKKQPPLKCYFIYFLKISKIFQLQ